MTLALNPSDSTAGILAVNDIKRHGALSNAGNTRTCVESKANKTACSRRSQTSWPVSTASVHCLPVSELYKFSLK